MSRELGEEEEEKEDVGRCIGDSIARGTIAAELFWSPIHFHQETTENNTSKPYPHSLMPCTHIAACWGPEKM